jgi:hypothetical protein
LCNTLFSEVRNFLPPSNLVNFGYFHENASYPVLLFVQQRKETDICVLEKQLFCWEAEYKQLRHNVLVTEVMENKQAGKESRQDYGLKFYKG